MDADQEWLTTDLSLESEARMAIERAMLRRCNEAQLLIAADNLLEAWFHHKHLLAAAFQRIQKLKVDLLLADAPPSKPEPSAEHYDWAAELHAQRLSSS